MEQDGEEIPAPTPINKIHLGSGDLPVLIDVFMPSVRERMSTRFVKKDVIAPGMACRACR